MSKTVLPRTTRNLYCFPSDYLQRVLQNKFDSPATFPCTVRDSPTIRRYRPNLASSPLVTRVFMVGGDHRL